MSLSAEQIEQWVGVIVSAGSVVASLIHAAGYDQSRVGGAILKVMPDLVGMVKHLANVPPDNPAPPTLRNIPTPAETPTSKSKPPVAPIVGVALFLGACSSVPLAAAEVRADCDRLVQSLDDSLDAGLSCEEARIKAQLSAPKCTINIHCKGGSDAASAE